MNPTPKIHVGLLRKKSFPDIGVYFQVDIILASARGRERPECWKVFSVYSVMEERFEQHL